VTLRTIAIHGLGLIGGSLGMSLRARRDPPRVLGYDVDLETARTAVERGAVDALLSDSEAYSPDTDLVVTAVPPRVAASLAARLLASMPEGAVLTDLSSVMLPVLTAAGPTAAASGRFVGSHPLRGSEQGGIRAARSDLYEGAQVLVGAPLAPGSAAERVDMHLQSIVRRLH